MSNSNGNGLPAATEIIHLPRPSWAPAFFALGVTLMVASIFLSFMGPNWAYTVIGAAFALGALSSMISGARRDFYRLPRRQQVRSAALPADSIRRR